MVMFQAEDIFCFIFGNLFGHVQVPKKLQMQMECRNSSDSDMAILFFGLYKRFMAVCSKPSLSFGFFTCKD